MIAQPLRAVGPEQRDNYDRSAARARVESATAYECDNTAPLAAVGVGAAECAEDQVIDGKRRRQARSFRVSSIAVTSWLWRLS